MFHIFKHKSGKNKDKYDTALILKGKKILVTNQGYSKLIEAYKAVLNIAKYFNSPNFLIQDNEKKVVLSFNDLGKESASISLSPKKPIKFNNNGSENKIQHPSKGKRPKVEAPNKRSGSAGK